MDLRYDIRIDEGKLYNFGMLLVETSNNDELITLLSAMDLDDYYFKGILEEVNRKKNLSAA